MKYDPEKHHRRSVRLKGYDYAQAGAYYVTICTHDRFPFFEDEAARILAEQCWLEIPQHFPYVELDEWVVMPNHLQGILVITDADSDVHSDAPTIAAPLLDGIPPSGYDGPRTGVPHLSWPLPAD